MMSGMAKKRGLSVTKSATAAASMNTAATILMALNWLLLRVGE